MTTIVFDSCTCTDPQCPRWRGLIRDTAGFWRYPTEAEIKAAQRVD